MGPPNNNVNASYFRRKGRGRALSAATTPIPRRRTRFNSAYSDSDSDGPANDEPPAPEFSSPSASTAAGILLALTANNGHCYTPPLANDKISTTPLAKGGVNPTLFASVNDSGGSGGSQGSTPPTTLSSACLLVAAAVGPLAPGFKFPKTKKGLMNEWLNKSPDLTPSPTLPHPSGVNPLLDDVIGLKGMPMSPGRRASLGPNREPGSAKKRWLRQAISEECDSPRVNCGSPAARGDSPPYLDIVTPLKKRRLARESVNSEESFTPPTTPTEQHQTTAAANNLQSVYEDDEAPASPEDESDADRRPKVATSSDEDHPPAPAKKQGHCEIVSTLNAACFNLDDSPQSAELLESELSIRERVDEMKREFLEAKEEDDDEEKEKEEAARREDEAKSAKRKLSISEYRQRKQLGGSTETPDPGSQCASPRKRSNSSSSSTSSMSTDDEAPLLDLPLFQLPETPGDKKGGKMVWNSAPTLVERQRENLTERLKREFGLFLGDEAEAGKQGPLSDLYDKDGKRRPLPPPPPGGAVAAASPHLEPPPGHHQYPPAFPHKPPPPPLAPSPSSSFNNNNSTGNYISTITGNRPNGQAPGVTPHANHFATHNNYEHPRTAGGHFTMPSAKPFHTVAAAKAYYPQVNNLRESE